MLRSSGSPPRSHPATNPAPTPHLQTVEPRPRALLEGSDVLSSRRRKPGKTSRESALWGNPESGSLQEVCVPKSIWLHWQMTAL